MIRTDKNSDLIGLRKFMGSDKRAYCMLYGLGCSSHLYGQIRASLLTLFSPVIEHGQRLEADKLSGYALNVA
jgi:hypothetical protein